EESAADHCGEADADERDRCRSRESHAVNLGTSLADFILIAVRCRAYRAAGVTIRAMTDTTGMTVRHDDSTEVRFGTRGMLVMMAVVAACATAFGAFVRLFPEDARWHVVGFWAVLIVILAGLTIVLARRRYVAEKKVGRTLFELAPHSY